MTELGGIYVQDEVQWYDIVCELGKSAVPWYCVGVEAECSKLFGSPIC